MTTDSRIESLFGSYVVDAVSTVERVEVERYLRDHPDAALEVSRMTNAFDEIVDAHAFEYEPPAELWNQIVMQLPDRGSSSDPILIDLTTRDADRAVALDERRAHRANRFAGHRVLAVAAAAVLVVLLAAGGLAAGRATRPGTDVASAGSAAQFAAGGSRLASVSSTDGRVRADVVAERTGEAFVVPTALPILPADQTYQLWSLDGPQPVSLGLVGDGATAARFTMGTRPEQLALSVEPAGGSAAPTTPVASGRFS